MFVKVAAARVAMTGSGVVVRLDDDPALVVTNEHGVAPLPAASPRTGTAVVLHSGRAVTEKVVSAELLAADASRDLAVLRVKGVKDVAKAIDLSRVVVPTETMTVYTPRVPVWHCPAVKVDPATQTGTARIPLRSTDRGTIEHWVQPGYANGARKDIVAASANLRVNRYRQFVLPPPPIGVVLPPRPVPTGPVPEPRLTEKVAATATTVDDLTVTKLEIGARNGAPCLCWAADAKAFYHVDGRGTVRWIRYPRFREEAALATGREFPLVVPVGGRGGGDRGRTRRGVGARPADAQGRGAGAGGRAKQVASAPNIIYGVAGEPSDFQHTTVRVFDLKTGKPVRRITPTPLAGGRGFVGFDNPVFSPDGKHLYATGGLEQLYRFDLNVADLKLVAESPRIIAGPSVGPSVGADYVAAPSGGGNYGSAPPGSARASRTCTRPGI